MFFRMALTSVITVLFLAGCSEDSTSNPSINVQAPACPAADLSKDYVGCWDSQNCQLLDLSDIGEPNQWRTSRFYLTSDGRFYDFTWAYDNPSCTGKLILTDNGIEIRLKNFIDRGTETMTTTGNPGHRLSFTFKPQGNFDVLSEINPGTGEICFSSNLGVSSNLPTYTFQNGTVVDYTNCLNPAK